jgi:hypothetical protein
MKKPSKKLKSMHAKYPHLSAIAAKDGFPLFVCVLKDYGDRLRYASSDGKKYAVYDPATGIRNLSYRSRDPDDTSRLQNPIKQKDYPLPNSRLNTCRGMRYS